MKRKFLALVILGVAMVLILTACSPKNEEVTNAVNLLTHDYHANGYPGKITVINAKHTGYEMYTYLDLKYKYTEKVNGRKVSISDEAGFDKYEDGKKYDTTMYYDGKPDFSQDIAIFVRQAAWQQHKAKKVVARTQRVFKQLATKVHGLSYKKVTGEVGGELERNYAFLPSGKKNAGIRETLTTQIIKNRRSASKTAQAFNGFYNFPVQRFMAQNIMWLHVDMQYPMAHDSQSKKGAKQINVMYNQMFTQFKKLDLTHLPDGKYVVEVWFTTKGKENDNLDDCLLTIHDGKLTDAKRYQDNPYGD